MTALAPVLPPGVLRRGVELVDPAEHPFFGDPVGWHEQRLGGSLWSKQRDLLQSVAANRYTAVHACYDVGKSYSAASIVCWWLDTHPVGEAFVVSTAPVQHQVEAILWREIREMHGRARLQGEITPKRPTWSINGRLVGFGRKPADYADADMAAASFQGIHDRYVLVVLDEAGGIPKWLFDAADSLVTNEDARLLAIGNPRNPASHFAEICKPGSGWNVIHIDGLESPNFTDEPVPDWLRPLLIGPEWVEERRKRWGEDSPLWEALVRGRFPKVSDDTTITPEMIERGQQTELPGLEQGRYAGDVARFGDDTTVIYRNRGGQVRYVAEAHKQDTMATAGMFGAVVSAHGEDRVPMIIDAVGIGAGVYDRLRERELPVYPFNGADRASDPERFANRRAEMWWTARDMLEAGELDIDPEDEELAAELQRPKWRYDSRNRILIESKDDMRKRGLASPNRADALVMSLAAPPLIDLAVSAPPAPTLTGDLLKREM